MTIENETKELLFAICALLREQIDDRTNTQRSIWALRRTLIEDNSVLVKKYEKAWDGLLNNPAYNREKQIKRWRREKKSR